MTYSRAGGIENDPAKFEGTRAISSTRGQCELGFVSASPKMSFHRIHRADRVAHG